MLNEFLIKKPLITEKAATLGNLDKYVFVVEKNTSSAEIKKALKKIYGVDVIKVNIINLKPKSGAHRGKSTIKRGAIKKAIVTLKSGQSLDIIPK